MCLLIASFNAHPAVFMSTSGARNASKQDNLCVTSFAAHDSRVVLCVCARRKVADIAM